ncbi:MAG: hypothetical protein ACRD4H_10510, partial [Candidatus Acidiferrales bacterium]
FDRVNGYLLGMVDKSFRNRLDELLDHEKPPDVRWDERKIPLRLGPTLKFETLKTCDALCDFLMAQEAAYSVAGLGAATEPIFHALGVELYNCGILQRIVCPHNFNETTVARASLLDDHNAISRLLLLANAGQSDHQHFVISSRIAAQL